MSSLFENKDASQFLDNCSGLLMQEADRGCILLGVSMLDEELNKLFKMILPSDTSKKRGKEIFDGKGAFGNLSFKLDIAYVCHLLPADLVSCIHRLRKLRNKLAHSPSTFTIQDNLQDINEVFSLVKGDLPSAMINLSGELVLSAFSQRMMQAEHPTEVGINFCENQEEAYSYIPKNEGIQNSLNEQRIKIMLVIGISSVAALIIKHREKALKRLGIEA